MMMNGTYVMIGEVAGTQTAAPMYRLLDHEASLIATTDTAGSVTGTAVYAPYGQTISSSISDAYSFTGLLQAPEGHHATYRDFAQGPGPWISPDPYNGSYDLMNPQSFNRYMYVNGNPLAFTDPSGLVDGWANGLGGGPCSAVHGTIPTTIGVSINPCAPLASAISIGIYEGLQSLVKDGIIHSSVALQEIAPWVGFGISVACDFDSGSHACGQKDWTGVFIGGTAGKLVSNSMSATGAIFATICAASGGWACAATVGYGIYTAADDLFGTLWDMFGVPHFHGTLLPRAADDGGLGTSAIGVPNQNLSVQQLIRSRSEDANGSYERDRAADGRPGGTL